MKYLCLIYSDETMWIRDGHLEDYHLAHSARAELCRRLGRITEARSASQRALALAKQLPERRFLERRLGEMC